MNPSTTALNLIAKWEGFRGEAYRDIVGVWTLGYGATHINGQPVKKGDKITKSDALALLQVQIQQHASTINKYVTVYLTQNQFDALASFQYNLGKDILKGTTLLFYLNSKQWNLAAKEMLKYINAGGKPVQGLINRRNEEVALFLKPETIVKQPCTVTIETGVFGNENDAKVFIENVKKLVPTLRTTKINKQ